MFLVSLSNFRTNQHLWQSIPTWRAGCPKQPSPEYGKAKALGAD